MISTTAGCKRVNYFVGRRIRLIVFDMTFGITSRGASLCWPSACVSTFCGFTFEPSHEMMALFVLRKLILQTRMQSHPVGLDTWFLVGPFVCFHTLCVRTAKALARLRGCTGSPEPSLVTYVISTIISWAGSFTSLPLGAGRGLWLWHSVEFFFFFFLIFLTHGFTIPLT